MAKVSSAIGSITLKSALRLLRSGTPMLSKSSLAMRKFLRHIALAFALLVIPSAGVSASVAKALPGAELRGQATFRYLGFQLYDARLFTKNAAPLNWSEDFGLELTYKRKLTQYDMVEATLREMKRVGPSLPIRTDLERCYKGVSPGDRYLAVSEGPDTLRFWYNGSAICTLRHPGIKTRFMSIFLGENTRSTRFTRALKGQ